MSSKAGDPIRVYGLCLTGEEGLKGLFGRPVVLVEVGNLADEDANAGRTGLAGLLPA